jgi:hypothetical protein
MRLSDPAFKTALLHIDHLRRLVRAERHQALGFARRGTSGA